MGNCIDRCKKCSSPEKEVQKSVAVKKPQFLLPPDEDNRKLRGMRVKIVLTKEELQMLMVELKNNEEEEEEEEQKGKRTLEDVLDEIERVRRRSVNVGVVSSSSWKPSLESIAETESPDQVTN